MKQIPLIHHIKLSLPLSNVLKVHVKMPLTILTDEVKPSQPVRLPTSSQRKDDQQLTNLNRKLYETKTDVTDAAEDLLNTANEVRF